MAVNVSATGGLFTLGEALAVFLPEGGEPLASAEHYRRTVAGSETNVAVAVARLGIPACLVTVVGNDGLGDAVEHTLVALGIDARVGRSDLATGTLVRDLANAHSARAVHLRLSSAATELSPRHVDAAWTGDVSAVFVTGITAVRSASASAAVYRAVHLGRSVGAIVVADPNLRPKLGSAAEFARSLAPLRGLIDVAIGDLAELSLLSGTKPDESVAALIDQGCTLVITKLGADGAVATDGVSEFAVPSRARHVVDTVGAGDAFAGGVIAGLIEGSSVMDTLDLAAAVAGRVVESVGDIEGLPWRRELEEMW